MTVATEAAYAEAVYTGVETLFTPGFSAQAAADVLAGYFDSSGLPVDLTQGVHFSAALDAEGAVTVTPIAFPLATPAAPVTIWMQRDTPAIQGVDFTNLNQYDPAVHERIADAGAMRDAEIRSKFSRGVQPFNASADTVDFRPRTVRAADPVEDADVATKSWVLSVTGLIDIANSVAAAAASAVAAAASAALALVYQSGAQDARDTAQAWSDTPENSNVPGTSEYSAFHWSQKAAAAAASLVPYLSLIDYGFFSDAPTDTRDYGSFS